MSLHDVIKRPLVTEKSTQKQTTANEYFFEVRKDAAKGEIQKAVETLFKVSVTKVTTMNVSGRSKMFGRNRGKTPDWKKAIVSLKEGDKIEFFAGAR